MAYTHNRYIVKANKHKEGNVYIDCTPETKGGTQNI